MPLQPLQAPRVGGIQVIHIYHGARDIDALFGES
jgi:hypothetical protein